MTLSARERTTMTLSARGVDTWAMLLSDEVLRAIGRVAVLAGHLELSQYFLTGALIGPDAEAREELARPTDSFGLLQDLARRLAESRYGGHDFRTEHPRKQQIDAWSREAKVLMEERNAVMHGTWGIGSNGMPGYLTKRKPHQGKKMSVADLDALGNRIEALDGRSVDLIQAVAQDSLDRARAVVALLD